MGQNKKRRSILAEFSILLVALGVLCGSLFFALNKGVGAALESYLLSSDVLEKATQQRVSNLQEYVTENQVSTSDAQALTQWIRGKPLTLMEVYRDSVLVYSSSPSYSVESAGDTWTATELEEAPYYDWISYYTVEFADGEAQVVLYSNELFQYSTYATIVEIIFCAALFLTGFLVAFQRTARYIRQLSQEIQAMESGDLDRAITVRGGNDLTALAECLDAMRVAFRAQQEREAQTYAANQALISEMSHDLRTPLTTLLLYTEILRYGKYQGEEQLHAYLDRVDEKAQQIKQLAENILEYSLAAQNRPVELQEPLPAQEVLGEALHEALTYLSQCGYTYELALDFGEAQIAVHIPYIRRLVDNISSNILKYADRRFPVQVQAGTEGPWFFLRFRNRKGGGELAGQGTGVGLSSLRSMMDRMGGSIQVEQTGTAFQITLEFPLSQEKKENA